MIRNSSFPLFPRIFIFLPLKLDFRTSFTTLGSRPRPRDPPSPPPRSRTTDTANLIESRYSRVPPPRLNETTLTTTDRVATSRESRRTAHGLVSRGALYATLSNRIRPQRLIPFNLFLSLFLTLSLFKPCLNHQPRSLSYVLLRCIKPSFHQISVS